MTCSAFRTSATSTGGFSAAKACASAIGIFLEAGGKADAVLLGSGGGVVVLAELAPAGATGATGVGAGAGTGAGDWVTGFGAGKGSGARAIGSGGGGVRTSKPGLAI